MCLDLGDWEWGRAGGGVSVSGERETTTKHWIISMLNSINLISCFHICSVWILSVDVKRHGHRRECQD